MKVKENVAYLRGLAEGLELEKEGKTGKFIHEMIKTLDKFADAIRDLEEENEELREYVEDMDSDLLDICEELEELDENLADIYDELDDMEEDIEDLYECDCCDCDEEDDDDYGYIEMECPYCGELVEIDEDELYDDDLDIVCPYCEEVILSSEDFDDECEDDCCSCSGCCGEDEE